MRSIVTSRGGAAALALGVLLCAASVASAEGWGTVKGKITYKDDAKLPDNPEVTVTTDKAFCLKDKGKILRDEWVVNKKNRGIKNVIVWLSDENPKKAPNPVWDKPIHEKFKTVPAKLEIDQPVCTFRPRIITLREGTVLWFKNSATVSHNVKIDGGSLGPQINTAIPPGKALEIGSIKARMLPTEVACTIHPWMKSWLVSFKHPYYAVTDENGEFQIKDAPPGKYRLQIWHEGYGFVQKGKDDRGVIITIRDGKTTNVKQQLIKED
jgi:hypothetical protein